jgi:hypothetical protein
MVSQVVADRLRQSRLLHFPFHAGNLSSIGLHQVSLPLHPEIVTLIVRRVFSMAHNPVAVIGAQIGRSLPGTLFI